MKKSIQLILGTVILTLCQNISFCQFKKMEFTGHVKGIKSGIVEILVEPVTDSVLVKLDKKKVPLRDGIFQIQGKLLYPYPVRIIVNDSVFSDVFFIESGKIRGDFILKDFNTLSHNIISLVNNEDKYNFQPLLSPVLAGIDSWWEQYYILEQKYNQNIPSVIEDSISISKKILSQKKDSIINQYIVNHNSSFVGLWNLYETVSIGGYNTKRNTSFNNLDKKLQTTFTGIKIKHLLDGGKKIQIGSLFPPIPIIDLLNKKHTVNSKLFAKYTLLDFWFSHCGPCRAEFPNLITLYDNYKYKDFQIIGISIDNRNDKSDWINAIKQNNLPWPQYWDINGVQTIKLGILRFPTKLLLDQNGKIIAKDWEIEQINDFLKERLGHFY